jgi:2-hydroxy-6-oxonona-2,4-dienedioate hydrolase
MADPVSLDVRQDPPGREQAVPPVPATDAAPSYVGLSEGRWMQVGDVRTWYADGGTGNGAPIVLVHGGHAGSPFSFGSWDWARCFPGLSAGHRVIAVDRLAQGATGNPVVPTTYTMQASVDHLTGFLEGLDEGPVHLVGHSRGGYVTARAALERQDLVASLTLVDSSTLAPGVGLNEVHLARPPRELSREGVRWMYEAYAFDAEKLIAESIDACWAATASEKYQTLLRHFAEANQLTAQVMPQLARDKRVTLQWLHEGRLQRPTHIVWGGNDRTARPERGLELFEVIRRHERRTTFSMIDKASHFPFIEHSAWFAELLCGFVDEVDNAVW